MSAARRRTAHSAAQRSSAWPALASRRNYPPDQPDLVAESCADTSAPPLGLRGLRPRSGPYRLFLPLPARSPCIATLCPSYSATLRPSTAPQPLPSISSSARPFLQVHLLLGVRPPHDGPHPLPRLWPPRRLLRRARLDQQGPGPPPRPGLCHGRHAGLCGLVDGAQRAQGAAAAGGMGGRQGGRAWPGPGCPAVWTCAEPPIWVCGQLGRAGTGRASCPELPAPPPPSCLDPARAPPPPPRQEHDWAEQGGKWAGNDEPKVSPYRLAGHLTAAFAIYTTLVWTALGVAVPYPPSVGAGERAAQLWRGIGREQRRLPSPALQPPMRRCAQHAAQPALPAACAPA